jgi:hypothetical protein
MSDFTEGQTKVEAPNKNFTGLGPGGLAFADGVAYTNNPVLIDYCARHGYKVTGPDAPETDPTTVFEDPNTVRQAHQNLSAPSEDASASRGMTEEQRREAYGEAVGLMLEKDGVTPPFIAPGPLSDPNEIVEHPGGTEQVGLTRDQADHAAAVRAGLATPKTTRKSTSTKSTRKSTARKSTGTRSGSKAGGSSKSGGDA